MEDYPMDEKKEANRKKKTVIRTSAITLQTTKEFDEDLQYTQDVHSKLGSELCQALMIMGGNAYYEKLDGEEHFISLDDIEKLQKSMLSSR